MVEYDVHGSTQELLKIVNVFDVLYIFRSNKKLIIHVVYNIPAICLKKMFY